MNLEIMVFLFLIKLARFINASEQKTLAEDIEQSLNPWITSLQISDDKWAAKYRLVMEVEPKNENFEALTKKLLDNPGISSIINFPRKLFNWEFSSFQARINQLADFLVSHNPKNVYTLDFRAIGKLPSHKKAILDRLERKKFVCQLESEFHLYLEIRPVKSKDTQAKKIFQARIGKKFIREILFEGFHRTFNPKLVLYSPFTTQEVADFFRLSLTFNIPIILTNENNKVHNLIKRVQKTFFKGIEKIFFESTPSLETLLTTNPETSFGFSLWGTKTVSELPSMIQSFASQESNKPTVYFIFGNEKKGLPLFIRYSIPIFRICRQASETLRSSLAASYVLGTLFQYQS